MLICVNLTPSQNNQNIRQITDLDWFQFVDTVAF
jgi:hypothetical protein